jgi:hypothetical protein
MCFSAGWLLQILIWGILVVGFVMILRIFLPWLLGALGVDATMVMRIIQILIWMAVSIYLLVVAFQLFGCFTAHGPALLPH